ncbi:unnamed protein product [Effrenium voratum]|nr:unnamed protein product [Effrenium voratum]
MGESLLRAHVQALKGKVPQVQRMELEDNILELKVAASGVYRLNFLVYEVDAYPDSGGVMMSEDEAATELVDAINARLEDAARLLVSEVLQITLQALEVSWQPDVDMQDGAEETVAFEGEDEGGGVVAVEQTFERCLRPGWKKLKWQEVEDQRLASREKRRRGADLTNEEQKAAEKQIFNSSEAFGILSNELYSLQTQGNGDIQADAVDFSVYHWAVKLRGFSKLAPGLAELRAAEGYDYVELRVVFKEDLHPFYPPSITLVRPRLCGSYDVQAALVCHPRLQLKGWSPFLLSSDLLLSVRAFLDRIARVDLGSPRNNVQNFPEGAFSPLERLLVQLGRLREVAPQNLRPAVPGNAYEDWMRIPGRAVLLFLRARQGRPLQPCRRMKVGTEVGPKGLATAPTTWGRGDRAGTSRRCMRRRRRRTRSCSSWWAKSVPSIQKGRESRLVSAGRRRQPPLAGAPRRPAQSGLPCHGESGSLR